MGQDIKMQIPEELKMLLVIQTLVDVSFLKAAVVSIKISFLFYSFSLSDPAEIFYWRPENNPCAGGK